jgi:hypothetical protein
MTNFIGKTLRLQRIYLTTSIISKLVIFFGEELASTIHMPHFLAKMVSTGTMQIKEKQQPAT